MMLIKTFIKMFNNTGIYFLNRKRIYLAIIVFICFNITVDVFGYEVPIYLWKGVLAEASGEGYEGMYRVTCVVRNRLDRNMAHGLCGLKRKDLDKFVMAESEQSRQTAKRVIKEVFQEKGEDRTFGATHFESIDFRAPSWSKKMIKLGQYKKHIFYKEKK